MKTVASIALLATCTSAFSFAGGKKAKKAAVVEPSKPKFTVDTIPGALAPVGLFDPLNFGSKGSEATLRRYREAELTHGRVSMLAVVGFLVGEAVEGKTALFNGEVTGPAITHIPQVNPIFWLLLTAGIAKAESIRAQKGFVEPGKVPVSQPGLMRESYSPGDLGFDPLGLKPKDGEEYLSMQLKELQNGRLAMLAAAGFLAQELADGKGIIEHLTSN